MFVVTATYLTPREEMAHLLPAHADWLKSQHETGIFIASGCNVERTGGAIIAQGVDREALEAILAKAPFALAGTARYDIKEMGSLSQESN